MSMTAVAWAQRLAQDSATLYLDTETTGLGPYAEVVEIAIVDHEGQPLLDTLVRPSVPIEPGAALVHGLGPADLAGAPAWADVAEEVSALLEGRPVVVYNAAYDRRVISHCQRSRGLPEPPGSWECAMQAFAAFLGQGRGRRSLAHAAAYFGVAPGGHRALGDALACRGVVLGMARYGQ